MIKGYSSDKKTGVIKHLTLQPLGEGKYGSDSSPMKIVYPIDAVVYVPEVTSTNKVIDLAGHPAKVGDTILFGAGALSGVEVTVISVTTNSITISNPQPQAITAADTFGIYRAKQVAGDSSGALQITPGPIQYVRDGANTVVTEDTATPANNRPLPVKLQSVTGDINITANDLNVQLQHNGANPDSTQIGDGTNLLGITATNEAKVSDVTSQTSLASIDTKMDLQATLAQQLLGNADLSAINTKMDAQATEATLALVATEVTAAAILAKIIAAPATEAKQDTIITALNSLNTNKGPVQVVSPISVLTSNIPASSALPLEIVAATSAAVAEIQTVEDVGEYIGLYTGAASSEVLLAILPIAGGKVSVNISAGTRLSIRHMKNTTIATNTYFAVNLIG